ncbi:hypothetical protein ACFY19_20720 [Streptosporangium saharense]|uniref:hypothetical protein n=1 Tax=Streptosporangium saharense TaxID=1706840 RepID=UPI0036A6F658
MLPQSYRLTWRGDLAKGKGRAGAARGLGKAAAHLLGEAKKVVPLEEGTLADSGVDTVDADSLTAAVSFDGPYAVRQHEELDYQHDAGRQAKYLEEPATTERGTMLDLIAAEIRRSLA